MYLLVRRKKQNVFLEVNETDTVHDVKLMLEGILKKSPENQALYYLKDAGDNPDSTGSGSSGVGSSGDGSSESGSVILLQDNQRLLDYGVSASVAKAQSPARLGLCFKIHDSDSDFEPLDITAYSSPPPLPDIMKKESE